MTTMRKALFILLLLSAFAAWSCRKELGPEAVASGDGSIELKLNSGNAVTLQTKATDLEEGLKFNNVLVILVNNSGTVVGNVYKTYPYTPGVDDIQDAESDTSVAEDVIHFNGLLPGNYQVYAYANIDASAWQGGNLIATQEKVAAVGSSFSALADRELAALTGTGVPADPSSSMLLTGRKEVAVGLTRVSETLDLLRPVVRFKVTVRNHTPFPVRVDEIRFSQFNPDRAYLIDHRDDSGVPAVPSGVTYREMPAFDTAAGDDSSVAADTAEVVYQRLLYENAYSKPYRIFATMTLDRTSESLSELQLSLGDHPFGVIDYATLNSMDDGEEIDVLVTNPQISPRSGRIFAYISANNYMAWESAGYGSFNGFFSRAQAIYNQDASFTYAGYTNSSTYGYSAWDGVSATPKEDNQFDYTGARSRYFHRLTKTGNLFTLEGLAINNTSTGVVNGTSITGIRVEAGAVVNGKNPADVAGKLVRFINNANGKYIQANTNYDANQPKKKESNLMWQGDGSKQDRQFMLFGKYLKGGPLKRILKDNNKEVPLTYMVRNEEINVVINVYYSDTEGTLDFVVDNSTWKTATTVTHTFK